MKNDSKRASKAKLAPRALRSASGGRFWLQVGSMLGPKTVQKHIKNACSQQHALQSIFKPKSLPRQVAGCATRSRSAMRAGDPHEHGERSAPPLSAESGDRFERLARVPKQRKTENNESTKRNEEQQAEQHGSKRACRNGRTQHRNKRPTTNPTRLNMVPRTLHKMVQNRPQTGPKSTKHRCPSCFPHNFAS